VKGVDTKCVTHADVHHANAAQKLWAAYVRDAERSITSVIVNPIKQDMTCVTTPVQSAGIKDTWRTERYALYVPERDARTNGIVYQQGDSGVSLSGILCVQIQRRFTENPHIS
jgi:hypothetical protein